MPTNKTLLVSAIKNGTVIDHIATGKAADILSLLRIEREQHRVTIGMNLESSFMGKKDLIKIEGFSISDEQAGRIAILAPAATINIIKNYSVIKKFPVQMPDAIERIMLCQNPTCITNHDRMQTKFTVKKFKKNILLTCAYCEKIFQENEISYI